MSSDTQLQLVIHDVPQAEVWALAEVLVERELRVDWDGPLAERGTVHVGEVYTDRCAYGDLSRDIAAEIIEVAPGATFQTWTDPTSEWLGELVRYTPELGRHDADCTADGDAVFTEHQILRAFGAPGRSMGDAVVAMRDLVGAAWTEALTGRTVERTLTAAETAEG